MLMILQVEANEYTALAARESSHPNPPISNFTGPATRFAYDQFGHETSRALPDGEQETFTYVASGPTAGMELTHTDFKGQTEAFQYDTTSAHGGRLQGEYFFNAGATVFSSGTTINTATAAQKSVYTYDALGRVSTVTDDSGVTTNAYDVEGNLTQVVSPEGTISYGYNSLNQHTSTVTSSTQMSYGYDNWGRLTSVTANKLNGSSVSALTTSYFYDADGNKIKETLPNGLTSTYSYDSLNRLTEQKTVNSSNVTILDDAYTLNPDGSRASVSESQLESDNFTVDTTTNIWTYDAQQKLLSEAVTSTNSALAYTDTYTYDLNGNRLAKTHVANASTEVTIYTYNDDNQLAQTTDNVSGTTTYTYDANGSQTKTVTVPISGSATTNTYTYDLRNRMVGFTGGGNTASYVYDDAGNRVEQTTNGTNKYFVIDANNPSGYPKPIEVKSSPSAAPLITYLIGDRVFGQANGGGSARYLAIDGVGATRALITSAGSVAITFSDDAFKNAVNYNPAATGTFWMQDDAMYDGISGLSFHGSGRQSNNATGRWMTADDQQYVMNASPLSDNLYLLNGANLVNSRDPSGHEELAEVLFTTGVRAALFGLNIFGAYKNGIAALTDTSAAIRELEQGHLVTGMSYVASAIFHGGITALNVFGLRSFISDPPSFSGGLSFNVSGGAVQLAWEQLAISNPSVMSWIGQEMIPALLTVFQTQLSMFDEPSGRSNTGPTNGVLDTGTGEFPEFESGEDGPAKQFWGQPGFDAVSRTHAEAHAAAYMRINNIKFAVLRINNDNICPQCMQNLKYMLDHNSVLTVIDGLGRPHVFTGI